MKVLAIIVSYNFERWIDRCLSSLQQSTFPIDIVVIDNASQDQTVQRIKKDYPDIRLIESKSNLGFGRANNIGMTIAIKEGYESVLLINQDAWINKETIEHLIKLSIKHPQYGILSPVHLTGSGERPDPGFAEYACIENLKELPQEHGIIELPFINAAFWLIPVRTLNAIGGFCPLFYHYGEDKDFINRIHYHGYKVGYSPHAFGCHDREYRTMTHQQFLRTEYVYHLSEYANIKYSFPKSFGYGVLAIFKKSLNSLFKGKIKLFFEFILMGFRLLAQTHKVYQYRKQNLLSHPNYIS